MLEFIQFSFAFEFCYKIASENFLGLYIIHDLTTAYS